MEDLTPKKYDLILNLPGLAPPRGVIPNFEDPGNQNGLGIAVVTLCASVGTILFFVRLYSRLFCGLPPKLEDYLGLLAFLAYIASTYAISAMIHDAGFFIHQWNLHIRDVVFFIYNAYTFLTAMMLFAKTAVLLEWIRIFVADRQRSTFFYAACSLIGINAGIHGKCIDRYVLDTFTAFINLAIDLGIFLLPQKIIWKLQMSKKRKIGVSVLFSVGLIACASAAGRAYYTVTLDFEGDVTYEATPTFLFGYAEMTTVLMVFCIPSIPKAFQENPIINTLFAWIRRWTRVPLSSRDAGSASPSHIDQHVKQPDYKPSRPPVNRSTEDTLCSVSG
ncbi:hypothetical protein GGR51DRAFT_563698 [Nemania sp. FL0031]|nr:hypothetical protein GGR51DRAFT_563698 [Nemania sp. FL0031]